MKASFAVVLLVLGGSLLGFSVLPFAVFGRSLSFENPILFMEALFVAGATFVALGSRVVHRLHRRQVSSSVVSL